MEKQMITKYVNKFRNFLADQVHVFPESYFANQSDADKARFRAFNVKQKKLIETLRPWFKDCNSKPTSDWNSGDDRFDSYISRKEMLKASSKTQSCFIYGISTANQNPA